MMYCAELRLVLLPDGATARISSAGQGSDSAALSVVTLAPADRSAADLAFPPSPESECREALLGLRCTLLG